MKINPSQIAYMKSCIVPLAPKLIAHAQTLREDSRVKDLEWNGMFSARLEVEASLRDGVFEARIAAGE